MPREEKKEVFRRWGYGLFIHYGLYSVFGRGEWLMFQDRLDAAQYYRDALPGFQPHPGCAREWVELAKRGGMKYAVLTTRHHEGFFIGDALIREFVETCRDNGLGVGLYYSVADWSDPDFCAGPAAPGWGRFVEKSHRQVRQIMTDYGKVDYLFYDGCPPPERWGLRELHREIRALQPEMLVSRSREDIDVQSCEGHANGSPNNLWESCYTMYPGCWGYHKFDPIDKTPVQVANMLSDNRHNGGNLLLNISPMADGTVPPDQREVIETVGKWVRINQDALFDVQPHPFQYYDREITTSNGNIAYMRLIRCYGPERRIGGIGNRVRRITFLDSGKEIPFTQQDDVITLHGMTIPRRDDLPRFIRLELDGLPVGIRNPMLPNCDVKTTGE